MVFQSSHNPPRRLLGPSCAAMCLVLAGASLAPGAESLQPPGWDAGLALKAAVDVNPDPRIVEIALEARLARVETASGRFVDAWTYDGGLPGPLIRVHVGDRLIVHFSNTLPEPTTVHWHGLRVPIQMDGVPGHSQPEVRTGQSFTYDFVVPDAGLFWYHPHVMSAAQVGFGLYGALLVEDPADEVGVADQLVLVLSDIATDARGVLEPPNSGGSTGMAFGREGDRVLVNGREQPTIAARAGAPQRWRVVNAAKSRYFQIEIAGTSFRKIGGDGGLQEYEIQSDAIVLAPGERADLIVTPRGRPGSVLTLRAPLYNRGYGSIEARFPYNDLLTMTLADLPPYTGALPAPVRRPVAALSAEGATAIDLRLTLEQASNGAFAYKMLGSRLSKDLTVAAAPAETQVWTLTNTTKWSHPFHLHGFFFQVLDDRGIPVRPLAC